MAINLDAVKAKLSSLQSQTTKQTSLWKPELGTQVVRIVPYMFNKENPFIELYFHYNFGKHKSLLSPISFGRPDPIQEFAEKLKSTGNSEEWKMGKKLEPTMRCYVPILVRGKESEGVKFWGFGKQVYQELLSFIADPDYGDISDPMNGRDITVEFKDASQTGKSYPETVIRIKPTQTPMTNDKSVIEKIKNQQNVTDLFKEQSYEELTKILEEWLDPDSETSEEGVVASAPKDPKSAKSDKNKSDIKNAATTAEGTTDVGAAFDELFN